MFPDGQIQEAGSPCKPNSRQHPVMANTNLHRRLLQCHHHGVVLSTRCTYQSGLHAFISFCARFNISPIPESSATLQYFCADISQHVSYKMVKVYLSGTRLMHGLPDPTDDDLLQLDCTYVMEFTVNRVTSMQRPRLSITINCLPTPKEQLRASHYSALEQRILWASFTLAFYGFLRTSEYTTLHWSDVTLTAEKLYITLHQSKINPFRHGHIIHLHSTNSLCAFHLYSNLMTNKLPSTLVFSAGTISPLTRESFNTVICCLFQQAGLNQFDYASHSFRIGAATTMAAAGLPTWLFKKLGR